MAKQCFLGIDIGTSSIRAVLFDLTGKQIAIEYVEVSILTSINGFAELEAQDLFLSTLQAIKGCVSKTKLSQKEIIGMGFSCQMHSLLPVDGHGEPLARVMTWADTRAIVEAETISKNYDTFELYSRTGCRVGHSMYPLSKLLWLKNNNLGVFQKASKFITIKEYIVHKLFGEYVVDYTLASSQGYFNLHTHDWDDDILRGILEVGREKLSPVVPCTYQLKMKQEYVKDLGLDEKIVGVIGSGDGIMANLGCGVFNDTALSSTIGTSGAIRTTVSKPLLDAQQRTWCYAFTQDQWVVGGAINNGGIVLKWLRETFRQQFEYDAKALGESIYGLFDRYAAEASLGSNGLIFLPYLTGERSPDWNANVRGLMVGLDYSHNKKHIIRAAMEGVMFRLFSVYETMVQLKDSTVQIKANGGYIQSALWMQIQADLFNKEIQISNVSEASALGAAFLVMSALGYADIHTPLLEMNAIKIIRPYKENNEAYLKIYQQAKCLYKNVYGDYN